MATQVIVDRGAGPAREPGSWRLFLEAAARVAGLGVVLGELVHLILSRLWR